MEVSPCPAETARLSVLNSLGLADGSPDPAFDRIVRLAQQAAGAPVVLVSFIDSERQWLKARIGMDACSAPRDISFCTHVVEQGSAIWVENTALDPRFITNPYVAREPGVRFYAGAPIRVDGQVIGTVCVIDVEPRPFDPALEQTLADLAGVAAEQCALQRNLHRLRHAEKAVQNTQALYANLFVTTSEPLIIVDQLEAGDFIFFDLNPAMEQACGLERTELVGKRPRDIFGDFGEELESQYRACVAAKAPLQFLNTFRFGHGRAQTFACLMSPLAGPDARITRVLVGARDVTEEHAAQTALKISRERFARVFDSSADALYELGIHGTELVFEGVNQAFELTTGLTSDQTLGRSLEEVFPSDDARHLTQICNECIETRAPVEREVTAQLPEGPRQWIVTLSPLRDRDEAIVRLLVSIKDISARKLQEAQRREAQKLEAIGQLAGGLAHDFNNLLQVIEGYTRQAQAVAPCPGLPEILKATDHGARLVRQLLVFSRRQISEPEPMRLTKAVRDLVGFIKPLLGAKYEVFVVVDEAVSESCIETDPNEFCQAMLNLAGNARDAMPDGGALTISLSRRDVADGDSTTGPDLKPGGYAVISVTDIGCGIAPEIASRIFDPFYTTKDQGKGTGLGLAMVYGFAQQTGGAVDVLSRPGEGATFRLHLPLTDKLPPIASEDAEGELRGAGETVLLVEDDPALLTLTRNTLESLDYFVLTATDGIEAHRVATEWGEPLDLIVSDIVLPNMGGLQMAERLRAANPGTPVVFVSGHPARGELQSFELPPGALFLQKPFKPADLARMARRALAQGAEAQLAA